ncbi:hypothetical protein FOXB_03250 [Fusarium oxysporum f. sp. conglutinans Fo5176]|uniref:ER-bound oxygenase mpaB/mpaB'/Rubber oxygenase catalytic domain-containing protein n=1 Tax=Fusarium oxysporum (strain Fo5176) TaxID=660025 RepID=F9FA25_FUSOF|nr:hypothetical protein FOXB_03250 [Fusarium oxysporum f. sp. conglutinans Fo5176]
MSVNPGLLERKKDYYRVNLTQRLPPGTDSIDQFEAHPRQPRPPAVPKRPVPEWPPESERKGKWISAYLDQLDPETEYDQIIRTANFFTGTSFAVALGYSSTFVHLAQTPAAAAAVNHGGKAYRRGHQRFYDTQNHFLDWMWYGSGSEETKQDIERVNKIHSAIWKNVPGSYSHPWEGQMSVIGSAYFETYLRRLVGARRQEPHPHLAAAWPAWAERVCAHFRTEPTDGSRSYGINFPRNGTELGEFYRWFQDLPFEEYTNAEDRKKGHQLAEAFLDQFSKLWFPRQFRWLGRQVMLTVLPAKVREQQQVGHPIPIVEAVVKLAFKLSFDMTDIMPDPVKPALLDEYRAVKGWDRHKIDVRVEKEWRRRSHTMDILLTVFMVITDDQLS